MCVTTRFASASEQSSYGWAADVMGLRRSASALSQCDQALRLRCSNIDATRPLMSHFESQLLPIRGNSYRLRQNTELYRLVHPDRDRSSAEPRGRRVIIRGMDVGDFGRRADEV